MKITDVWIFAVKVIQLFTIKGGIATKQGCSVITFVNIVLPKLFMYD